MSLTDGVSRKWMLSSALLLSSCTQASCSTLEYSGSEIVKMEDKLRECAKLTFEYAKVEECLRVSGFEHGYDEKENSIYAKSKIVTGDFFVKSSVQLIVKFRRDVNRTVETVTTRELLTGP
jgi:hypothetical protein